jgi:AbrB family looped-hinge helix DNA binding protein
MMPVVVARTVEMGDRGRLVIPAAVREELGLRPGTRLSLRVEDGVLILMTPEAAERELLEMFKDVPISLAGELLEDRRLEVQHEGSQS